MDMGVPARLRPRFGVGLLLAIVVLIAGCGGTDPNKPKLGKVSGKVVYKGQPVTSGTVTFTPDSSKGGATGQVASGSIGSDGSYELTTFDTGDGAILGQHVITVLTSQVDGKSLGKPDASGRIDYKLPKSTVPEKYTKADKSPLRFTVAEGRNTYEVDLKD